MLNPKVFKSENVKSEYFRTDGNLARDMIRGDLSQGQNFCHWEVQSPIWGSEKPV